MFPIDNPTSTITRPPTTPPGTPGYFTDGNASLAYAPTILPAEWLNGLQDELLNILKAANITPSKTVFNQLATAIQGAGSNFAQDVGTANAYVVNLVTPPAALIDGLTVMFKAAHANTNGATLTVNALGAQPLLGNAHQPLRGGEIIAGSDIRAIWNSTVAAWVMLENSGGNQQVTTAAQFDSSLNAASTAFVKRAVGNLQGASVLTASTTLAVTDAGKAIMLGGVTAATCTLPPIASVAQGTAFSFMSGSGAVWTIAGSGADVFAPNSTTAANIQLNVGDSLTVTTDGSFWRPIGGSAQLKFSNVFNASVAQNGWQRLPGGLIIQWGWLASGVISGPLTFPLAFPTMCFSFMCALSLAGSAAGYASSNNAPTTTGVAQINRSAAAGVYWIATGV